MARPSSISSSPSRTSFYAKSFYQTRLTLVNPDARVGGSISLPLNSWDWSAFPSLATPYKIIPIFTLQLSVMLGPSLAGATGSRMISSGTKSTQRSAPALNIGGPDTWKTSKIVFTCSHRRDKFLHLAFIVSFVTSVNLRHMMRSPTYSTKS